MLGVGGAFILVPLLILLGEPHRLVIGTSLAYIVVTASAGAIKRKMQGDTDLVLAAVMLSTGVLAVHLGATSVSYLPTRIIEVSLAILLFIASFMLIRRGAMAQRSTSTRAVKKSRLSLQREAASESYSIDIPRAAMIGAFVGFLSGLLGVGGGWLLVPLMITILNVPFHVAAGTSLIQIIGVAAVGAISHYSLGNVDIDMATALILGGLIGAPAGAAISKKMSVRALNILLILLLLAMAVKLMLR